MMMMLVETPQQKVAEQSKVVKEGCGYCKFADDEIPTVMTGSCQDYSAKLKNVCSLFLCNIIMMKKIKENGLQEVDLR